MPFLTLRPTVSYTLVGPRPVFLDVRNDRYCALSPAAGRTLQRLHASPEPVDLRNPEIEEFLASGLFALGATSALVPVCHPRAKRGIDSAIGNSIRLGDVLAVARSTVLAQRSLRRDRLAALATPRAAALSMRDGLGRACPPETLAHRFLRARRLLPIAPRCLPDSLALRVWLERHGHPSTLVFAVRLKPFSAHCWLESDGVVLNDAPDRIDRFIPIGVFA